MGRLGQVLCIAVAVLGVAADFAAAADRWEEAAGGASAILPAPTDASGIVGGSLFCAEQKWGLLLRTDGSVANLAGPAKLGLEGQVLDLLAIEAPGTLTAPVPTAVLDLMRTGTRMRFEAGAGKAVAKATFNLRNSQKVIEAIAPRCSQIDMSAYEAVTFLDAGPAVDTARTLFQEEIGLFRDAANKEPTIAAVELPLTEGRRLVFGRLCGSTWYYGTSGCTVWGWAAIGPLGEWRPVYSTEGVNLYLDRKTMRDGWPGLATLPMVNGTEAGHWFWAGSEYEVEGEDIAADELAADAQGDAAQ